MKTKQHCALCHGCGRVLTECADLLPYGSTTATLRTYEENACPECDGTGLSEDEGCFVCQDPFENDDTLVVKRGHLIHAGCTDEDWPADSEPVVPEEDPY